MPDISQLPIAENLDNSIHERFNLLVPTRIIIIQQGILFSLSVKSKPKALEDMSDGEFDEMMDKGLTDAKSGISRPVSDVFSELRKTV